MQEEFQGTVEDRSGPQDWVANSAESSAPRFQRGEQARAAKPSAFPELDCVRGLLPLSVIRAAEIRAVELGVGADRVLIADGVISEEDYIRALAELCGVAFEPLDRTARSACPFPDERLIEAPATGMLPLRTREGLVVVVAPRGTAARQLAKFFTSGGGSALRVRFTTHARLLDFVVRHCQEALGRRATEGLNAACPGLSAAPQPRSWWILTGAFIVLGLIAAYVWAPVEATAALHVLLSVFFIAWIALRLFGSLLRHSEPRHAARQPDSTLPVYTVVAALYREATSVRQLVSALEQLDYPREKLDIKLVIEPDDKETRAALEALRLGASFDIITAPDAGPRTKPKALNAALPFAHGTFAVVYDAEDRPEPDQLRRVLTHFRADKNLACVQAKLTIDNTADSWLSRFFTAEYAGQFDVFLPGLSALRLPLPLGGSSNHFRTAVLREIGAWDPYNVTEDADLGMRLSRFGYSSTMVASTTYEEAPARFLPWLKQRTRWFKGWMQTWLVHMRSPRQMLKDLGLAGFLSFQLVVAGNVLAALVYPLFLVGAVMDFVRDVPQDASLGRALLTGLYGTTLALGFLGAGIVGWLGLRRRGLGRTAWVLLLIPLHWLLLSLAAWRALHQLIRDPYRWEKTEHGVAQTSRRGVSVRLVPIFPKRQPPPFSVPQVARA